MSGFKQIAYYGVAILVLKGLGFLMLPIATRILSQDEYGSLNFLVSISAICSLLLSVGLPELIFRQYFENKVTRAAFFRDCLFVSICVCTTFLITAFLFTEQIISVLPGTVSALNLRLLSINLFASSVLAIPYCYYRLTDNAKYYCYLALTHGLLQTSLSILLLLNDFGVVGVMLSGSLTSVLILAVALYLLIPHLKGVSAIKKQLTKQHGLFIVSILVSSLCLYASNGAENWFIVAQEGEGALAIYFVAAQFALMTSFMFEPIRMWWFAKRFHVLANSPRQYSFKALLCLNIGLLSCAIMMVLAPLLFNIALPSNYHGNEQWLIALILVVVFRHHSDVFNIGCYKHNNGIWVSSINVVSAISIISAFYYTIPLYQIHGVILSLIVVQSARSIVFIVVSQWLERINYDYRVLYITWASLLAIAIIAFVQPDYMFLLQITVLILLLWNLGRVYRHELVQGFKSLPTRVAYV
jgi:O-antigen/teichoic acid export membrane protein